MIKILTIIGARPQIIKAAALSRAIRNKFTGKVTEKILHTGQHYDSDMSDIFFSELGIPLPDYNLNAGSGPHGEQTARMISGTELVLSGEKFDAVVLYGDTNSTLAGAVAASKMQIPIVHIEAGLRSFNMAMPEEINRIVCDQLSTLLFAPTQTAINNLAKEGLLDSRATFADNKQRHIFLSGDIMYDNTLYFASVAEEKTNILERLKLNQDNFILVTVHRDNNTDNPERLSAIFDALLEITKQNNIKIVVPMHPRTRRLLSTNLHSNIYNELQKNNAILLTPPVSFFEMIVLEKNAKIIMTDSGGVQKEAYFLKKPCIILRPETEWTEILEQQAGFLTDTNKRRILEALGKINQLNSGYPPVFGNGQASQIILDKMIHYLL